MGRKAKHNWAKLFTEFCQGEYATIASFARKKKLNENQVRDEFRKLNGTRSKIIEETNRESTENKSRQQTTEKRQEKAPVGGRQRDKDGLTVQQKTFVMEYLLDFNATRAAIAAGYSKKTAYSIGWELIRKPAIQKEIQRQTEGDIIRLGLTRERQLLEYMRIGYANVGEYVKFGQKEVQVMGPFGPLYKKDDDGEGGSSAPITKIVNYVDFEHSEAVDTSLIREVKQGKDGVSIKLHDKMKALDKLDKYLDLLPDEHKRYVENEKLKIEKERLALEKAKLESGGEPGKGNTWADLVAGDDDDDIEES